jgi:hypothetical protein
VLELQRGDSKGEGGILTDSCIHSVVHMYVAIDKLIIRNPFNLRNSKEQKHVKLITSSYMLRPLEQFVI